MLPAGHRLTRRADFAETTRLGSRAARGVVVAHVHLATGADPALVGFVVSKAVGGSVVRHQVTRRLRAVMAERLPDLPTGSRIVLRALPGSATTPYAALRADVDAAVAAALGKAAA